MIKIGLVGEAASGKDTAAAYFCANYGLKRFALADRMKYYFGLAKGYTGSYDEIVAKVNAKKDRAGLISYGQACRDAFGADVWIEEMFADIDNYERKYYSEHGEHSPGYIVTDVRQQNEYAALKDRGFVIVRISAPLEVRIERMKARGDDFDPSFMRHHTETFAQTVEPDFEVENGSKWANLAHQCDYIIRELKFWEKHPDIGPELRHAMRESAKKYRDVYRRLSGK
ncbi:nucleoside/nucleotide kinase family protein [Thermoactinomyces vulgaris]|uniref:hypothetical protein n=1 Tax=Thermoactinomyces vulgaris TaxID=2026 RepID=UPI0036410660